MSETKRDTGKGDYKMSGVKLTDIVEKMNLKNLTPGVDITERKVHVPDWLPKDSDKRLLSLFPD